MAVKQPEVKREKRLDKSSFLGTDGKFYISNPVESSSIAVYVSPEAYNKRSHLPTYINKEDAEKLFLKSLPVDLITLQIID